MWTAENIQYTFIWKKGVRFILHFYASRECAGILEGVDKDISALNVPDFQDDHDDIQPEDSAIRYMMNYKRYPVCILKEFVK